MIETGTSLVHIHKQYNQSIILELVYFPPNSPITVLDGLQVTISEIKSTYPTAKVLLGGDFNSPGINWHHKVLLESYVPAFFQEKLLEVAEDFHFEELVTTPIKSQTSWTCFLSVIQILSFRVKLLPVLVAMIQ